MSFTLMIITFITLCVFFDILVQWFEEFKNGGNDNDSRQ